MKRIFTILTACTISMLANAQTYFADDFEAGSLTGNHAWNIQSVANPDAIVNDWIYGTVSGNYAKCSNFDGANHVLNLWLISPVINLSTATAVDFSFDMTKRYAGDDMKVQISNDYTGAGLPSSATWTDISNLFTLDANDGSWSFVGSGVADISAYLSATTYIAFEYIGGAADGATWEVDNILIEESGNVPAPGAYTPIYDIQYTTNPNGESPLMGTTVTTKGIVTGIFQFGDVGSFFIQDGDGAWNGLYIFETGTAVTIGDSVMVTGLVDEYFTLTELKSVSNITILNSGNVSPTPAVVTGNNYTDEEYEGVLVMINNAVNTVVTDQYGAWTVNDGNNAIIDSDLMVAMFNSTFGNGYSVTGVRHFSFSESMILPRNEVNDIITTGYASINENNLEFSVYPNPASNSVTVSGIENGTVAIYAVSGKVVYNSKVNGNTTINIEGFTTGIYTVEVIENKVKANYKLIVE
jgi:hypothetical protein